MTYLILQTALIMLAAYIAGALIGCMARRMIYGGGGPNLDAATPTSIVDGDLDRPMIETNDGSAARAREKLEAERFARVLTQAPGQAPGQALAQAPSASAEAEPVPASLQVSERFVEPEPWREPEAQPEAQPEPWPEAQPEAQPEPWPEPQPEQETEPVTVAHARDDGESYRQVSTAAAAAAATAALAAASAAAAAQRDAAFAAAPAQDLTLIRGIDASTSDALAALGITRYEQIASWRADDVQTVDSSLGSAARPSRENWIEQAKILAGGGQTAFSRSRSGEDDFNLWQWVAATSATITPTYPPPMTQAPQAVDDRGIDAASPTARQKVYGASGAGAESTLSSQADEGYSSEGFAASAATAAAATAAAVVSGGAEASEWENDGVDDDTTIAVMPPAVASEPEAVEAALAGLTATSGDDLTRIKGIDKGMQDQLVAQGITAFLQLANWKADDIARFEDGAVGVNHGRVGRENWIEQAQILAAGGDTEYSRGKGQGYDIAQVVEPIEPAAPSEDQAGAAYDGTEAFDAAAVAAAAAAAVAAVSISDSATSQPVENATSGTDAAPEPAVRPARLADAIKARQGGISESQKAGLAGLRSVRSEALRGQAGAAGPFDDLKRIRGIGVLIEKKLNSLGITSFEQIANWSNSEIDRLSQVLDFKGRIERENWVEQARILASGGHTEFSRRLDQDRS